MKGLVTIVGLLVTFTFVYSQNQKESIDKLYQEINRLTMEKEKLSKMVSSINDSIEIFESEIDKIKLTLLKESDFVGYTNTTVGAKIRKEPNSRSDVVATIPKNKKVKVIDYGEYSYWLIEYNGTAGYANEVVIKVTEEMNLYLKVYETRKQEEKLNKASEVKTHKIEQLEKQFGKSNASRISRGQVWIGMTDDMARASWGSPDDINKSIGSWGVHEQWVYEKPDYKNHYLYFENGKLTSIQK